MQAEYARYYFAVMTRCTQSVTMCALTVHYAWLLSKNEYVIFKKVFFLLHLFENFNSLFTRQVYCLCVTKLKHCFVKEGLCYVDNLCERQ